MSTIKHFIFDFGDVFINLDKPATQRALQLLGMQSLSAEMLEINKQYEKGLLSTEAFIGFYQTQFPQATPVQLKNAWNSIIKDFPLYRLDFIKEFSKKHHCYLLSNINDLHLNYIEEKLPESFYNQFMSCFDKVYYSHQIHLRKPDKEIYEYVLNDAKLHPEECLFIDDTFENIEAAKQLGIHTWHLLPELDVVALPYKKLCL